MGFTVCNLKDDVDDAAPAFGLSPDLEARFARKSLESKTVGVSYQRLQPTFRIPFGHRHAAQEEIYLILSGSAQAKVGDETIALRQWDALRVDPETMRGIEAGPDGVELIAVGAPIGDANDAEMVNDWW
jgi:mannose-6-phosphate isomerase-like protein (cupin superfamily)